MTNLLIHWLKSIDFNLIKRDKFNENSSLIRLIDSYFQSQSENRELLLPELKTYGNQSISIFSDYGGEHSKSKYHSYSFLFCGWNHSYRAKQKFEEVRKRHTLEQKEISFKDLRFGPLQRALDDSIFRKTSAYGVNLNVSDNQHDSGKNRTSNKIRNFQ